MLMDGRSSATSLIPMCCFRVTNTLRVSPPNSSPVHAQRGTMHYVSHVNFVMYTSVNRLCGKNAGSFHIASISIARFTNHCMIEFDHLSLIRLFAIVLAQADSFIYLFWLFIELNKLGTCLLFRPAWNKACDCRCTSSQQPQSGKNSIKHCRHLTICIFNLIV